MGVREETLELLWEGHTPAQIAQLKGVSMKTTLAYLDQMVGEGRLRRSDILLSIPAAQRKKPETASDRDVVRKYGQAAQLLGDIYEDVRYIEVTLHDLIRVSLQGIYGEGEKGWWRQGLPESVRKSCHSKREEDNPESLTEPYNYTDLMDIRQIIEKKWSVLQEALPTELSSDKRRLMADLLRLNQIRRMVMHPVRRAVPSEEEFDFLRTFRRLLEGH